MPPPIIASGGGLRASAVWRPGPAGVSPPATAPAPLRKSRGLSAACLCWRTSSTEMPWCAASACSLARLRKARIRGVRAIGLNPFWTGYAMLIEGEDKIIFRSDWIAARMQPHFPMRISVETGPTGDREHRIGAAIIVRPLDGDLPAREEGGPVALVGFPNDGANTVAIVCPHLYSHRRWESLRVQLEDRKSTRLNSSHQIISYAVFC